MKGRDLVASRGEQLMSVKRAAVVGAGLSGLTAAHRLQQAGWQVTLFEASDHFGGRVRTIARDGYLIDIGASALADSYTGYLALIRELGLADEIVAAAPRIGIFRDGQVHELRLDQLLRSGLNTRVLSWSAKLRLSRLVWDIAWAKARGQLDYGDMARAAPLDTESAASYAHRALGREVDDYFASTIARTMLIADSNKVSKVEFFSGVANILNSRILALRGGQGRLPELLAARVGPKFGHPVRRVLEQASGVTVSYLDPSGGAHEERFDVCVVSCPLPEAFQICEDKRAVLGPLHAGLRYTQSMTVALALTQPPHSAAFLALVPACEDAEIALLFLDHNKSSDRAPVGHGLINCHWETDAAAKAMDLDDDELIARSFASARRVFPEIAGGLAFGQVARWPQALPLTEVGAYRLIGAFNATMDPASRIQFASDYMSAAGQNTAVELANRAVERIAALAQ